jgi:hypothetical protein
VHPVLFHIGSLLIPAYGTLAAAGVLLALFLAQRTAPIAGVNPGAVWNLCVLALVAALAAQRLLLIAANWSELRRHPGWMLGLAMIHHPLLASVARWPVPVARHGMRAGAGCRFWPRPMRWPRPWPSAWPLNNWARCWPDRAMESKPGRICRGL